METNIKFPAIVAESQFPDLWVENNKDRLLTAENIIEPIICIKIKDEDKSVIISGFTALVKDKIDYIYVTEVDTRKQALAMFQNNLHSFYNKDDRSAISQELNLLTDEEQKELVFEKILNKTELFTEIAKFNVGKKNSHEIKSRSLYQIYKANKLSTYLPNELDDGLKILANYSLVTLPIFDVITVNTAYKIAHLRILWKLFPYVVDELKKRKIRYSEQSIKELFSEWENSLKEPINHLNLKKALPSEAATHSYVKKIAMTYINKQDDFSIY